MLHLQNIAIDEDEVLSTNLILYQTFLLITNGCQTASAAPAFDGKQLHFYQCTTTFFFCQCVHVTQCQQFIQVGVNKETWVQIESLTNCGSIISP